MEPGGKAALHSWDFRMSVWPHTGTMTFLSQQEKTSLLRLATVVQFSSQPCHVVGEVLLQSSRSLPLVSPVATTGGFLA